MAGESNKSSNVEGEKKLKPCCVCLETKKVGDYCIIPATFVFSNTITFQARDECVLLNGEEHCLNLIEAHKKCLRDLGFQI